MPSELLFFQKQKGVRGVRRGQSTYLSYNLEKNIFNVSFKKKTKLNDIKIALIYFVVVLYFFFLKEE